MGMHSIPEPDWTDIELSPREMQAFAAAALVFACNEELRHSSNVQVNGHLTSIKKRARELIADCGIPVAEIRAKAFALLTQVYQETVAPPNGIPMIVDQGMPVTHAQEGD